MSLRLILAVSAALVATPVLAQTAPPAPPAAPAAPAAPAEMTPEQMTIIGRVQTAGEALEQVMNELQPAAAAVRADAALSATDKETRIRARIAGHQPVIDEFTAALGAMVQLKALEEGATVQEADQTAAMVSGMVSEKIAQSLITGEDPDGGE